MSPAALELSEIPETGLLCTRQQHGRSALDWWAWHQGKTFGEIPNVGGTAITPEGARRKATRALRVLSIRASNHDWDPGDLKICRIDSATQDQIARFCPPDVALAVSR